MSQEEEENDSAPVLECSNCQTPVSEGMNFCSNCGQQVKNKIVPIKELAGDVVRDTLGFESKFINSFPKLLFKPGFLTNKFIEGKRASYIPAIRMYIFISVITFLIFSIDDNTDVPENVLTDPGQTAALLDTMDLEKASRNIELGLGGIELGSSLGSDSATSENDFDVIITLSGLQVDNMAAFKKKMDEVGFEAWMQEEMPDEPITQFFIRKMMRMYEDNGWQQLNNNIERNLSVMMFFLIPFFALLMKLILWRSYYVVHLIFCFHLVSFFFIDVSFFELLDIYVLTNIGVVALVLFLPYFYIALKKVYDKAWWATTLLTLLFIVLFVAATTAFLIGTSLISVALY